MKGLAMKPPVGSSDALWACRPALFLALLARLLFFVLLLPIFAYGAGLCDFTWFPIAAPNSPGKLVGRAVAYDSRRHVAVVAFGGTTILTEVVSGDTWEWDGNSWMKRSLANPPAPRTQASMVYDSDRGVCVMFGGYTNGYTDISQAVNDTWEYDGSTWTLRLPSDRTATDRPRSEGARMVYDSARRKVVLLEGQTSGYTWEWDGNSWVFIPVPTPPPHPGGAMAYDAARGVTVLFGGVDENTGTLLNDTWTYDGRHWTQAASSGPTPREGHAMAFDPQRKVVVMFGGADPYHDVTQFFNDTWEWNGVAWTLCPGANQQGIAARENSSMWYDSGDLKLVVFGGEFWTHNSPFEFLDDLYEGRPPGYWVDFSYAGAQDGSFYTPFETLAGAVAAAPAGCTINLKAGSSGEVLTISKQLALKAYNGTVTIGH
jgi:hypothetical protein